MGKEEGDENFGEENKDLNRKGSVRMSSCKELYANPVIKINKSELILQYSPPGLKPSFNKNSDYQLLDFP